VETANVGKSFIIRIGGSVLRAAKIETDLEEGATVALL
jgi:hypothetical protein